MQATQRLARPSGFAPFKSGQPVRCFKPAVSRQPLSVCNSAVAAPAKLSYKSADGADKGTQELSLNVAQETAKGLVHRYLVLVQQNARRGTASTLTKSEVRGGGKKPYQQKGTGNARRGSSTSPLFPGGGVTFGPKPKDWSIKMNKKERRLALATALQSASDDIVVVESLEAHVQDGKTKTLLSILGKLGVNPARKALLIVKEATDKITLAGRNVEKLAINTADAISIFDVLNAETIVVEDGALTHIQSFFGKSSAEAPAATSA